MINFSKLIADRAHTAHEHPCIADATLALSNREFHHRVLRAATVLARHGVKTGDVVAVMLPNQVEFVVAMFAAWWLGAAITPINPTLTQTECSYQITDAQATLLINSRGESVVAHVPVLAVQQLDDAPAWLDDAVADSTALALLIYTSGTTGLPKGVMLDHANLAAMTDMGQQALKISAHDHCLLVLPLFHVNGIVVSILVPLAGGGRVTMRQRFDSQTFFDDVEQLRPSYFSAVPTIYALLNALPNDVTPDTSSLRFGICGAAPASAALLQRFEQRYGFPIIEGYGLSEGTCASTINPVDGVRKAGTVGLPFVGQRIAIADATGRHLAVGETGEVLVQGANVMRGYLGKPDDTARTIINGWLHTGDIGRIDADGYLSIVGRLKEMIIRGGENIYPKEIEDVLCEYAGVFEAAVVGVPDDTFGEIVVAYVSVREGATVSVAELDAHCASRLTRYKRPVTIHVIDHLPKNAVGKPDKRKLRALL